MRFLIVAYSVAPLNVISAQRANSLVRYLAVQGHEVDVLTSVKGRVDGPLDAASQWHELSTTANVFEVPFLGRTKGGIETSARGDAGQRLISGRTRELLQRLRAIFTWILGALFDYRSAWGLRAISFYRQHLSHRGYDVLITTSGPVCTNIVGARIKQLSPKVKWVADFRDLWSLLHSSRTSTVTRKLERRLEVSLLKKAALVTTVSEELATQMSMLHGGRRVLTVRNGFDAKDFLSVDADRKFFEQLGVGEKFNIVYAGSIYPRRRDPSMLFAALAAAKDPQVAVHFFGFNLANMQGLINKHGVGACCFVHPPQSRERILAIQKGCDMNLFLESGEADAAGVLTGKLFELAALGRPILSLGPQANFESMRILRSTGLLLRWEELEGLAQAIEKSRRLVPDEGYIQTLQRDAQFDLLMSNLAPRSQHQSS